MKKVLITGGTGLIGSRIAADLVSQGFEVRILTRSSKKNGLYKYFQWDIAKDYIEEGALDVDCIIHLAGAGIADKRWSKKRKKILIESRTKSTLLLKKYLEKIDGKKPTYIGASAIGIYGNHTSSSALESENSNDPNDFLVEVTTKWEEAHHSIKEHVSAWKIVRIGIVLSLDGGALKSILIPFNFRMGNYFGNGKQWMSWIHIDDIVNIFTSMINSQGQGIYNGVSPNPITGKELVSQIAKTKRGPFIKFGIPEFVLKLIFGEMSSTILSSTKVSGEKIQNENFQFNFPTIEKAIEDLLKA